MVMVFLNGRIRDDIKDIGRMENSMEGVNIWEVMEKRKKVNGLREKEPNGIREEIRMKLLLIDINL